MTTRILIVEDSRTEALRARLVLERAGFQVSVASDGREGLVKAAQEQPDVILLDSVMPQMSGFEACGKLKIDPRTTAIPIIMLVSDGEANDLPSGPGLACLLAKPYDPQQLIEKVQQTSRTASHVPGNAAAEIKRYQAELLRAQKEIEAAHRTRSDFLANMSHELRTPLHEIVGMTELLQGTDMTPEQESYLNTTKTSSGALLSLITDVIEYSELEAGQLSLNEREFELSEPIDRVIEVMKPRASEKGLNFSVTFSAQTPRTLSGDDNRLRQILFNLVANSIKFTERGNVQVHVDVEASHDRQVDLHFRVSDTGIGIPADRCDIIFEPFQQSDTSATRRFGGLGMGLALAKHLVSLMEGRIWVESQIGQGSIFHFTVKMKTPVQVSQPLQPILTAKSNWPRPLQILVAEDSPTNQLIAKSSLKKAGHTVTIAVNGLEAVKAFESSQAGPDRRPFDLILMDVSMPEMDGLEATRAIRSQEKALKSHISIVAMTAFATQEYHQKCLEAGMDAYVTKPVRIDDLNKTLEPLMRREPETVPALQPPAEPVAAVETAPVVLTEALEIVGGDVDILREAVALSLAEVPEQLAELKAAMLRQDAKRVEATAHRLKGVMGNLGALAARDVGQELETMGEQNNLAEGAAGVTAFEQEATRVVAFYSNPAWEQLARQCQEAMDA